MGAAFPRREGGDDVKTASPLTARGVMSPPPPLTPTQTRPRYSIGLAASMAPNHLLWIRHATTWLFDRPPRLLARWNVAWIWRCVSAPAVVQDTYVIGRTC